MKKYLLEIESSGIILTLIGVVISLVIGYQYGVWPCVIGLLLWVVVVVYKAFHWTEYARENRQNISIMVLAILILLIQMIWKTLR